MHSSPSQRSPDTRFGTPHIAQTVLLLGDRYATRHRLFNRGDQALIDGLHHLLEGKPGIQLLSGRWKSFPYFNAKRLHGCNDPTSLREAFDENALKVRRYKAGRARLETATVRLLNESPVFDNALRRAIDGWMQRHRSLGLIEAAIPRLFRHHVARDVVDRIAAADVVVFNGDGRIADHQAHFLPSHLLEVYLALEMGKRVVTVNQTVDVTDPMLVNMVRMVYSRASMHLTREPLSATRLTKLGLPADRVVASVDSSWAIPVEAIPDMSRVAEREGFGEETVALTVRGDRRDGIDIVAWVALVEHIQRELRRQVVWIHSAKPHDRHVAEALRKRCGVRAINAREHLEIIGLMRHIGLLLTDRYHPCIFATIGGCPVLPLASNTIKVKGLFEAFSYPLAVQPTLTAAVLPDVKRAVEDAISRADVCREAAAVARRSLFDQAHRDIERVLWPGMVHS